MRIAVFSWIATVSVFLCSPDLQAYPEMVRHGYVNCTSCHASPSGGGVLTQYGRELSREILSTSAKEGESAFAYGLIKPPEWLLLGGDYRSVYVYRDTPAFRDGRYILMQLDLEAAVIFGKWYGAGTFGRRETSQPRPFRDHLISRRHYLGYRPTDELSFRFGRFQHAYGINTPDHVIVTKRGLGWDQERESYNLESAWLGEQWNFYATGIFGRPDSPKDDREKGIALSGIVSFLDRYKTGVSYFQGSDRTRNRHIVGPFAILGFSPKVFLLSELDFQRSMPKSSRRPPQWGAVYYQRLDYEFFQGFHGYLTQEFSRLDFKQIDSLAKSFGAGVQFFPRPHFELNLLWQLQQIRTVSPDYMDFASLLLHFYP